MFFKLSEFLRVGFQKTKLFQSILNLRSRYFLNSSAENQLRSHDEIDNSLMCLRGLRQRSNTLSILVRSQTKIHLHKHSDRKEHGK